MRFSFLTASILCAPLIVCAAPTCSNTPAYTAADILVRDVLIIGGGATGTYAGVRLQDQNKSVAIVEMTDKLGGHVDTLIDPISHLPIDYGVQAFFDNPSTRLFFNRFNVPLMNVSTSAFPSTVADFKTGYIMPSSDVDTTVPNLSRYLAATAQFTGLAQGAYDLGNPVPADLYLPFGDFVTKYNLTDVLQTAWVFAHGVGNLMKAPTLYVLQNFGQAQVLGLSAGYLVPATAGGNQEVYDKAAALLGQNVLFSTKVVMSLRTDSGSLVLVKTPTGNKVIKAKKVLVTIPPTMANLAGFDLSPAEKAAFTQWTDVPYFVGVLNDTGLPNLTSFYNIDLTDAPTYLPADKFVWRLETTGVAGYQTVKVVGEPDSTKAKKMVTDAVAKVGQNYGVTGASTTFAAWEQHTNLGLSVSPSAIKDGFYANLSALQGQKGTYWTGNAWCSDYSPLLWGFTENKILPSLLK
ncbi:amine oxidase-like protein [Pleomassaria siparia CBS 279.74]|uniref:Amine oxidase-like protein n=1 Tax=Pleomassaria siparia CBS 279.74 TaxID=1314801 RepID=A0A6G1KNA2_9PLEO|nr:amine oxidase-like protein [Pleomassaria siparia CBS 279.74]